MDNAHHNAQNVISMSDFQPETGYPALSQVEAYWDALRGNRLVPARSDVDPRGIDGALENAFVLERVAAGIARLRVAGTHLTSLMGMEVRGMPLTTFFAPTDRRRVSDALEEMFQAPATLNLRMIAPGAPSRPGLEARMILLPLKSDLGDISRALGCLVTKGELGSAPRRFDLTALDSQRLIAGDGSVSLPSPLPPVGNTVKATGFNEPGTRFEGKSTTPLESRVGSKRPPYLRLIKSDEDKD